MKDFKLNISSLGYLVAELTNIVTASPNKSFRVSIKLWRESRSLSQNNFQHVIYDELSKYLISRGRTDWTEKKTKIEMKNNFLGWVNADCTDMVTGEITIRQVLRSSSKLDVGEACDYITKMLDLCNNLGCTIKIPAKCEYRDVLEKQIN